VYSSSASLTNWAAAVSVAVAGCIAETIMAETVEVVGVGRRTSSNGCQHYTETVGKSSRFSLAFE
jgi:hypothetical protein